MIPEQELHKGLAALKVLWFAMLGSLVVYLFVGLKVAGNLQASMNEDKFIMLRTILYAASFVIVLVAKYVRRLILSGKVPLKKSTRASRNPLLQRYSAAVIVASAMSQSIGVFGLILFFLGKNTVDLYVLILVSATAMLMVGPGKNEVISLSEAEEDDSASGDTPE